MIPSQMLKGTLEGCILQVIQIEESYGYRISERLKELGFGEVSEGTIYPILLRLEKNGSVSTTHRASTQGPRRKYYSLTEKGTEEVEKFHQSWMELSHAVENLWKEKGEMEV
ncbi:MAG: PadR family transcriptional regulator [Lachnospiraceae bacterium]